MYLDKKQIYDLNNMNVAAQNIKLGDLLEALSQGGGSSGSSSIIQRDSYLEFPNIGNVDFLYIDTTANTSYRWDNISKKYYMVGFDYKNITNISGGNANV